jgi:hypothetical protein
MDNGMDVDYDPSDNSGMEQSTDESLSETDSTISETPLCTVAVANSSGGVLHAFLFEGQVSDATVIGTVRDEALAAQAMTLMLFASLQQNLGTPVHEFVNDQIFDLRLLVLIRTWLFVDDE